MHGTDVNVMERPCDGCGTCLPGVRRPKLGPWLRDEKKLLVTYGHDGPWEMDDLADENRFTMEAWGAQLELRAIRRRNRDTTIKTRAAGRTKGKPSYGFQYERIAETRANRERLRFDREAGLNDSADDAAWFRERYAALGRQPAAIEAEPQCAPGMVRRPTGETVADRWFGAPDVQTRKEILIDFGVRMTLFPAGAPVRWVPRASA